MQHLRGMYLKKRGSTVTTIYLAGPINGCTNEEVHGWRDYLTARLSDFDILSPVVRDYRGKEAENVADIVEGDKRDIDQSDVVIAYCPKPSVGTSMEVFYANQTGTFVIVWAPHGAPVSPWLRYHSDAVVNIPEEAVLLIRGV